MYYFFIACLLLLNIQPLMGMIDEHKKHNPCNLELEQLTSFEDKVALAEQNEAKEAQKKRLSFHNRLFTLKRQNAQSQLNQDAQQRYLDQLDLMDEDIEQLDDESGYKSYFYRKTLPKLTVEKLTDKRLNRIKHIYAGQKQDIEELFDQLKKDNRFAKKIKQSNLSSTPHSVSTQGNIDYLIGAQAFINNTLPQLTWANIDELKLEVAIGFCTEVPAAISSLEKELNQKPTKLISPQAGCCGKFHQWLSGK